jgi:hypothetical protein
VPVDDPDTLAGVYTQWSQVSAGQNDWLTLQRYDGTGLNCVVTSGAGGPVVGIIQGVPGPFLRLAMTSAFTAPMTFTLSPVV